MRNRRFFYLTFGFIGLWMGPMQALGGKVTLDPMVDFRAPKSLTELLQEGLLSLEAELRDCVIHIKSSDISKIEVQLKQLNDTYDTMVGRSRMNTLYSSDGEFLQKLIDRINTMIQQLEKSDSADEQKRSATRTCAMVLQELQEKIFS